MIVLVLYKALLMAGLRLNVNQEIEFEKAELSLAGKQY
jgi:hypothetical protein